MAWVMGRPARAPDLHRSLTEIAGAGHMTIGLSGRPALLAAFREALGK